MPSEIRDAMDAIGEQARSAAQVIARTPTGPKNRALEAMARQIEGARDRILEAWLVNRLSIHEAVYRPSKNQLYFCDTVKGETGAVLNRALASLGAKRPSQRVQVDSLGAIYVGAKVELFPEELPVVAAALKLSGLKIATIDL